MKSPFSNPEAARAIASAAPKAWSVVETNQDSLPYGHHWSSGGHGGTELILIGPRPVNVSWLDKSKHWQETPMANEALEIWIVPGSFRDSLSDLLNPDAPIKASLIYSDKVISVYAQPSQYIQDMSAFLKLADSARATDWPTSPARGTTPLSWANWKQDIARSIAERTRPVAPNGPR